MPFSVAGVTTAPSEMPISTSRMRIGSSGISIGRPASAAAATARIEPERYPAGNPRSPSVNPPAAANGQRFRDVADYGDAVDGWRRGQDGGFRERGAG